MNYLRAKRILESQGYRLVEALSQNEEKTLELLVSDELKKLGREIKALNINGKEVFVIQRFGEVFNGYRNGFMVRIKSPIDEDGSSTFIAVNSAHEINYHGKIKVPSGFSSQPYGIFWEIVEAFEKLNLYKKWTTLFRSRKEYPLEDLIPFLNDLLKVWDKDFYKIVRDLVKKSNAEMISADIANYNGKNWSGD